MTRNKMWGWLQRQAEETHWSRWLQFPWRASACGFWQCAGRTASGPRERINRSTVSPRTACSFQEVTAAAAGLWSMTLTETESFSGLIVAGGGGGGGGDRKQLYKADMTLILIVLPMSRLEDNKILTSNTYGESKCNCVAEFVLNGSLKINGCSKSKIKADLNLFASRPLHLLGKMRKSSDSLCPNCHYTVIYGLL